MFKKNGDSSIKKYEKKFTGAKLSSLRVSKSEIKNAYSKISKNELSALRLAKARVEKTEFSIKIIFKDKKINHDGINILKKIHTNSKYWLLYSRWFSKISKFCYYVCCSCKSCWC